MPTPGRGEALIANEAVGVAFADVLMREGLYPGVRLPVTPGYEVVGRVLAVGPDAPGIAVGDRIAALTVHGGYASHPLVVAADCVTVPAELASAPAAAITLNGLTAWQMLTRCVAREAVGRMLVWGAGGGVGSVLLDLGRHFGIDTYGVASGGRLGFVAARGATPIDRTAGDVAAHVWRLAGDGVDVVFDGVGGPNVATSFAALRPGGIVVMFGLQGGLIGGRARPVRLAATVLRSPRRSAQSLFMSNRGLRGYLVTGWKQARPDLYRADLTEVFRLAASGAISPAIHAELPLERAAEAHRMLNAGAQTGKIILRP